MTARVALATVGDRVIEMADVERRIRLMQAEVGAEAMPVADSPAADRLLRWVLYALIGEEVVAHEAQRVNVGVEAGVRAVPDGVRPELVAAVFDAVTADVVVSDEAVARYHAANADRFTRPETRRVEHVIVLEQSEAEAWAGTWRDGGTPSGTSTLDLTPSRFAGPVGDAVFGATVGDVVGPVRSELGWHVARVAAVTPARTVPVAEVREEIRADLLAAERGRVFDDWLEARRRQVVVAPGYEHPGDPRSPRFVHRH